ncbi:MAG: hypothetical protein ACTSPB_01400 [Candidatus Thorarchaeota archaeon]
MGRKRKSPVKHTVHTKHPRYNVPQYPRGSGFPPVSQVKRRDTDSFIRYVKTQVIDVLQPFYVVFNNPKVGDIPVNADDYSGARYLLSYYEPDQPNAINNVFYDPYHNVVVEYSDDWSHSTEWKDLNL